MRVTLPLTLLCLALGLSGCSKIREKLEKKVAEKVAEKAIETGTGGKVDIQGNGDNGTITFKDPKGGGGSVTFGSGAKVPDDFPPRVPIYPGAKVNGSIASNKGYLLMLETADTPDQVVQFYRSKLTGMKETVEANLPNARSLGFSDETLDVNVVASKPSSDDPAGAKTTVNLTVGMKTPKKK